MKYQKGSVTIVITAGLLFSALLFSLVFYKQTAYMSKKVNNEAAITEASWLVEGTLDCAVGKIIAAGKNVDIEDVAFYSPCTDELGTSIKIQKEKKSIVLTATFKNQDVSKTIQKTLHIDESVQIAPVVSASHLSIHGSFAGNPYKGEFDEEKKGWECVYVLLKEENYFRGTIKSSGLHGVSLDETNGYNCKEDYQSIFSSNNIYDIPFKKDFVYEKNLSPFELFFGVKDENHDQVKNSQFDVVLDSSTFASAAECGSRILDELNKGNRKIWVEGHCEIVRENSAELENDSANSGKAKSSIFNEIAKKTKELKGVFLLVHEGLFRIRSGSARHKYNGIIFHYNRDYQYDKAQWDVFDSPPEVREPGVDTDRLTFYHSGSLNIVGSLMLDAETKTEEGTLQAQHARVFASATLSYSNDFDFMPKPSGNGSLSKSDWYDL